MTTRIEHRKNVQYILEHTEELVTAKDAWYKDGVLHRDDGPAVITTSGAKFWYRNGVLHREGAPAMEFPTGGYEWYYEGKPHRVDGPAILVCREGVGIVAEHWCLNGEYHREDGPARTLFKPLTHAWYRHGKMHREDGPAYIVYGEHAKWFVDDKVHRTDGPAIHAIDEDGRYVETQDENWFFEGKQYLREKHPSFASKKDG